MNATIKATQFLETIHALRDENKLSENAHALLQDLISEKEGDCVDFFDLQAISVSQNTKEQSYRINHFERMLDDKINREMALIYNPVCTHKQAKTASIRYRMDNDLMRDEQAFDSLTFGEIEYASLLKVLSLVKLSKQGGGGTFVDLGSGTGRAVMLARVALDFDACIGLELLPVLHNLASQAKASFQDQVQPKLVHKHIDFKCEDFLGFDWSHASVVFAHSTCFDPSLLHAIDAKARLLQPGSYFITTSLYEGGADMAEADFEMIHEGTYPMTWGKATVYIFRRL